MQQCDGSLATDAGSNHTLRSGLDRSKVDGEGLGYHNSGRSIMYLVDGKGSGYHVFSWGLMYRVQYLLFNRIYIVEAVVYVLFVVGLSYRLQGYKRQQQKKLVSQYTCHASRHTPDEKLGPVPQLGVDMTMIFNLISKTCVPFPTLCFIAPQLVSCDICSISTSLSDAPHGPLDVGDSFAPNQELHSLTFVSFHSHLYIILHRFKFQSILYLIPIVDLIPSMYINVMIHKI